MGKGLFSIFGKKKDSEKEQILQKMKADYKNEAAAPRSGDSLDKLKSQIAAEAESAQVPVPKPVNIFEKIRPETAIKKEAQRKPLILEKIKSGSAEKKPEEKKSIFDKIKSTSQEKKPVQTGSIFDKIKSVPKKDKFSEEPKKISSGGIIDRLKGVYYFFEDKYYALLDKIDPVIPVYKIVDPIDKVFPSFILFILLIILLVAIVIYFIMSGVVVPPEELAIIKVVNNTPEKEAIEGADVSAMYGEVSLGNGKTSSKGEFPVRLPAQSIDAEVSVEKENFLKYSSTVKLEKGKTTEIPVTEKTTGDGEGKTTYRIYVTDRTTNLRITGTEVTISFSCSKGTSAPQEQKSTTGTFSAEINKNACGTLMVTASAAGYKTSNSVAITSETQYIYLESSAVKGTIVISVYDTLETPIEGAIVKIYDASNIGFAVGTGETESSGTYTFEDVGPGDYLASANLDGRIGNASGIELGPGETINVDITITDANSSNSKKLWLEIVAEQGGAKLEGAKVQVYVDNLPMGVFYADDEGRVEEPYTLPSGSHMDIIVMQEGYLFELMEDIVLLSLNANAPTRIEMQTLTEHNFATVTVKVLSYGSGTPVEDASVFLYDDPSGLSINDSPAFTNEDGNTTFTPLRPSTYRARAIDEASGTDGNSSSVAAAADQKVVLTINLVLGKGNFMVAVLDSETNEVITEPETPLVDVIKYVPSVGLQGDPLQSVYADDETGEAETDDFKVDNILALKISHKDYVTYFTEPLYPVDDVTVGPSPPEIKLIPKSKMPDLDAHISFDGVYDDEKLTSRADTVESGEIYYLRLMLMLPRSSSYADVLQYVRVGPDAPENIPSSNFIVKIKEIDASAPKEKIMSSCYSPSDPYAIPSACAGATADAKKANIFWQNPENQSVYAVVVKLFVEDNLEDKTNVKVVSRAKFKLNGSDAESNLFTKIFEIGEPIECTGSDCPAFIYKFAIKESADAVPGNYQQITMLSHFQNPKYMPDETGMLPPDLTGTEPWLPIVWMQPYEIYYEITNVSDSDLTPTITMELPQVASFEPVVISTGLIPKDSTLDNYPNNPQILIPPFYGKPGALLFRVKVGNDPNFGRSIMFFDIIKSGPLSVEAVPNTIVPLTIPDFTVYVKDKDTSALIKNAAVNIKVIRADGTETNLISGTTDAEGKYRYNAGSGGSGTTANIAREGDVYEAKVSKSGYDNATIQIPVSYAGQEGFYNPKYGCVSISPEVIDPLDKSNTTQKFTVSASRTTGEGQIIDCQESVYIKFSTKLDVQPETGDKADSYLLNPKESKTFNLFPRRPAGNPFADNVHLGLYPVYVLAMFKSDVTFFHAETLLANITDEFGSCLWKIEPVIYDFTPVGDVQPSEISGNKILNQCVPSPIPSDVFMPALYSDSAKIALRTGQQIPYFVTFRWKVDILANVSIYGWNDEESQTTEIPDSSVWFNINTANSMYAEREFWNLDREIKDVDHIMMMAIAYPNISSCPAPADVPEPDQYLSINAEKLTAQKIVGGIGIVTEDVDIPLLCSPNQMQWSGSGYTCYFNKTCHTDVEICKGRVPCYVYDTGAFIPGAPVTLTHINKAQYWNSENKDYSMFLILHGTKLKEQTPQVADVQKIPILIQSDLTYFSAILPGMESGAEKILLGEYSFNLGDYEITPDMAVNDITFVPKIADITRINQFSGSELEEKIQVLCGGNAQKCIDIWAEGSGPSFKIYAKYKGYDTILEENNAIPFTMENVSVNQDGFALISATDYTSQKKS